MSEETDTIISTMEILRLNNEQSNKITKKCIQEALIILMGKKEYDEISITDIVKKAGVSRTAYYRNYKSKDEVLDSFVNKIISTIYQTMRHYDYTTSEYWRAMFENLTPYANIIALLFDNRFGEKIENEIYNLMIDIYEKPTITDKYLERFWSGAICAIMKQWINGGMKESAEFMAEICCKIEQKE